MVLSWSEGERVGSIPPQRVGEVKKKSEEYLRVRRTRARVTEICREFLAVMDRIETLRREESWR
jgi:hypothetical protein